MGIERNRAKSRTFQSRGGVTRHNHTMISRNPLQAALFVLRTQNPKKALEKFRGSFSKVLDLHRAIWPGVSVKHLQPRFGAGKANPDQKQFFAERTFPTSLFVAHIAWAISDGDRRLQERIPATRALRNLLIKLVSCIFLSQ